VISGTTTEKKAFVDLSTPTILPLKQKIPPSNSKKKIIVIAGPTGVGKTALSLVLAKEMGGEIISADSMQVYREMDIGTAKVSVEDQKRIPHHLIDIRTLHETFNVMDFYQEAHHAIHEILGRGAVPIVVGGTGFYIHALIYGPPSGPPSEPEIRHKIVRALEIIALTNQKVSEFAPGPLEENENYDFRCWFLHYPKETLYPRLEMRCDAMIAEGFVEEVKRLRERGLEENLSASQAIGYRQCLEFLKTAQTQEDWDRFVSGFKRAAKRYAKRQFTWFRKEPLFRWLNLAEVPFEAAVKMVSEE
jgi:tRNA dimethylallyltransferase